MFDTLIKGGTIVDGTGNKAFKGDIAIKGKIISEVAPTINSKAGKTIHAENKIVCPGFIDIHSHADLSIHYNNHDELLKPLVMQGITTFVGGNCGFSMAFAPEENRDLCISYLEGLSCQSIKEQVDWHTPAEFMEKIEKRGSLLNMALLAGHGSLRIGAAGAANRLLSSDEQKKLERYLEESMEMGCLGLSTGLQYFPGSQSDTQELIKLGKVLKRYDGIFTSHLRSYSHTLNRAIDEVCKVGKENDIRIEISHLYFQPYAKRFAAIVKGAVQLGSFIYNNLHIPIPIEKALIPILKLIEKAHNEGVDVHFDMVPTSQGFTELTAFLPPYASEGGKIKMLERLKDNSFRKKMLYDIENTEPEWPHRQGATWSFNYIKITGWNGLRVMTVTKEKNKWMEGKTFPEIGKVLRKHPLDVICDLLIDENGYVMVFHTPTKPDDPFAARSMWEGFKHPLSMPVTDTILMGIGRPSHVFYDCYPRFISTFVKERHLLSLEEAIKKATSFPGMVMGIKKRGSIEKGNFADLVIFDLDNLGTQANFYNPTVFPSGIDWVFINGKGVVSEGKFQKGILNGDVLKRAI